MSKIRSHKQAREAEDQRQAESNQEKIHGVSRQYHPGSHAPFSGNNCNPDKVKEVLAAKAERDAKTAKIVETGKPMGLNTVLVFSETTYFSGTEVPDGYFGGTRMVGGGMQYHISIIHDQRLRPEVCRKLARANQWVTLENSLGYKNGLPSGVIGTRYLVQSTDLADIALDLGMPVLMMDEAMPSKPAREIIQTHLVDIRTQINTPKVYAIFFKRGGMSGDLVYVVHDEGMAEKDFPEELRTGGVDHTGERSLTRGVQITEYKGRHAEDVCTSLSHALNIGYEEGTNTFEIKEKAGRMLLEQ